MGSVFRLPAPSDRSIPLQLDPAFLSGHEVERMLPSPQIVIRLSDPPGSDPPGSDCVRQASSCILHPVVHRSQVSLMVRNSTTAQVLRERDQVVVASESRPSHHITSRRFDWFPIRRVKCGARLFRHCSSLARPPVSLPSAGFMHATIPISSVFVAHAHTVPVITEPPISYPSNSRPTPSSPQ